MAWITQEIDGAVHFAYDPAICDGMDCSNASQHDWCESAMHYTHGEVGHYCTACLRGIFERRIAEYQAALASLSGEANK